MFRKSAEKIHDCHKIFFIVGDENTVTLQDYLPKISQQSIYSTLFTTVLYVAECYQFY